MKFTSTYAWVFSIFYIYTLVALVASGINTNEEYPGKGIILVPGQDLTLQCNNTDDDRAKVVEWYKDGLPVNRTDSRVKVESASNSLLIEHAVDSDCGNYTCQISRLNITIAVKSHVKLIPFEDSRNVVQNQNIILTCNVTQGVPIPTLKWLKDGHPLNMSNTRIELKPDGKGIEGSELLIKDANFDDRAEYTCVATNDVGSANETILVRVKDKYAALWPFLGICAEVAILCTIIFIYEKRRQKPDFDDSENEQNTENKSVPDQEDKSRDVRHRK